MRYNEKISKACGLPVRQTYLDYSGNDVGYDQRLVTRYCSTVSILISNHDHVNDMTFEESRVIAEAIRNASDVAKNFFKAQTDWVNLQFTKLNCNLIGTLQSSTFNFHDYDNRITYSVTLKIFEGNRVCFIRSVDREGTEKLLHSSTNTDKTISEKVAGLELKAYLLKQAKNDDDVVSSEGI